MSQPPPDGGARDLTRRDFVKAMAAATVSLTSRNAGARSGETAVARLYRSLSAEQRAALCFPLDLPLRSTISSDGMTAGPAIGDLTVEQQGLCLEVFRGLLSEDGR